MDTKKGLDPDRWLMQISSHMDGVMGAIGVNPNGGINDNCDPYGSVAIRSQSHGARSTG